MEMGLWLPWNMRVERKSVVTTVGVSLLIAGRHLPPYLVVLRDEERREEGDLVDDEAVWQLFVQEGQQPGSGARAVGELELLELSQL